MKVWKGTTLVSEHNLLEVPVAICPFYSEARPCTALTRPLMPAPYEYHVWCAS